MRQRERQGQIGSLHRASSFRLHGRHRLCAYRRRWRDRATARCVQGSVRSLKKKRSWLNRRSAYHPVQLQAIKLVQKTLPTADPSVLADMASQLSPAGSGPAGTTEQQLGRLAGQPGSGGQQSGNQTFKTTPGPEANWRADKPPDRVASLFRRTTCWQSMCRNERMPRRWCWQNRLKISGRSPKREPHLSGLRRTKFRKPSGL